jgi:hypothetical protein
MNGGISDSRASCCAGCGGSNRGAGPPFLEVSERRRSVNGPDRSTSRLEGSWIASCFSDSCPVRSGDAPASTGTLPPRIGALPIAPGPTEAAACVHTMGAVVATGRASAAGSRKGRGSLGPRSARPGRSPASASLPSRHHERGGGLARRLHAHMHNHGDHFHSHPHGHRAGNHGHPEEQTPQAWLDRRLPSKSHAIARRSTIRSECAGGPVEAASCWSTARLRPR